MGAFVDLATGKLARLSEDAIASLTLEPKQEMNYRGRRIILPKNEGTKLEPVRVMRADIDYNRHMNNANYVRIAMELQPEDFEVSDMRVEYRIAAKLGDLLTPTLYPIDGGYIVSLAIDHQPSAIIEFLSRPQQ
jgi:acyl-ACP thioesterase